MVRALWKRSARSLEGANLGLAGSLLRSCLMTLPSTSTRREGGGAMVAVPCFGLWKVSGSQGTLARFCRRRTNLRGALGPACWYKTASALGTLFDRPFGDDDEKRPISFICWASCVNSGRFCASRGERLHLRAQVSFRVDPGEARLRCKGKEWLQRHFVYRGSTKGETPPSALRSSIVRSDISGSHTRGPPLQVAKSMKRSIGANDDIKEMSLNVPHADE